MEDSKLTCYRIDKNGKAGPKIDVQQAGAKVNVYFYPDFEGGEPLRWKLALMVAAPKPPEKPSGIVRKRRPASTGCSNGASTQHRPASTGAGDGHIPSSPVTQYDI